MRIVRKETPRRAMAGRVMRREELLTAKNVASAERNGNSDNESLFGNALAPLAAEHDDGTTIRWVEIQLDRMRQEGGFSKLDVLVTPSLARALLGINVKNRRLKAPSLEKLVVALRQKRWRNTGHPAVISNDGKLQDGQHRLTAIMNSNISAVMDLRFGVDPNAFSVTDTGKTRSAADVLDIAGFQSQSNLAATVRVLFAIQRSHIGVQYHESAETNDVILKYVDDHANDIVNACRVGHSSATKLKITASAAAAASFLIANERGLKVAEEFFVAARSGLNLTSQKDPIKQLRALFERKTLRTNVQVAAALIYAFNAYREGRKISGAKLELHSGSEFPMVTKK